MLFSTGCCLLASNKLACQQVQDCNALFVHQVKGVVRDPQQVYLALIVTTSLSFYVGATCADSKDQPPLVGHARLPACSLMSPQLELPVTENGAVTVAILL
jgi:hypothetical protein